MTSQRDFERRALNSALPHGITKISRTVYLLWEPAGPPEIEIVFVHGLSPKAIRPETAYYTTWTSIIDDGSAVIWPMTWLPCRFPGARVVSLSYNPSFTNVVTNWSTVQQLAVDMVVHAGVGQRECPVVFICHCVGGLVAKAIVTCSIKELSTLRLAWTPNFQKFFQNIRGFYFYATPHGGFLSVGSFARAMSDDVLGTMITWNKTNLDSLNTEFLNLGNKKFWKIACVTESRPTKFKFLFSATVVTAESAVHTSAGYVYPYHVSVSADHFEVCKPKDEDDNRFSSLVRFIGGILVDKVRLIGGIDMGGSSVERRAISRSELCDDKEITIFGVRDQAHSTRMPLDFDLKGKFLETKKVIQEIPSRMEKLRIENKVMIWHKQCEHLLERNRGAVGVMVERLDALAAVGEGSMMSLNALLVKFVSSTLICSMLEGEASLLFCSEQDNYNKAAFALSSPRYPLAPTFSRFGLVLRELDWTLDFMCCIKRQHVDGMSLSFDDWKWCGERCRLVFIPSGKVTMDQDVSKILEDDHCRQILDQDALRTSMKSMRNSSSLAFDEDNQEKLEDMWSKRLSPTSQLCERNLLPDCFWIDNPTVSLKHEGHLTSGGFKTVEKKKWLGETVAVGVVAGYPKKQLTSEASLLARVQHPNVVELMCCAYEKADPDPISFLATELMDRDLDLLIGQQLESPNGSQATSDGPPFALPVAVDIALQITEAMVHVRKCKVIHRDLKPKNCLVSPKYRKDSCPGSVDVPTYYTTKLIDFGTSRLRGENSNFFTVKQGTPCHMAPEVNPENPGQGYTWSADVWSLGMTFYKIFTGKAPFAKNNLGDIMGRLRKGERPEFPLKFPRLLKELIQRFWAANPSERPTIYEVREDLWYCKLYCEWPSNSAAQ